MASSRRCKASQQWEQGDRTMRRFAIAAALVILAVGPALAQAPPAGTPTRIRGTADIKPGDFVASTSLKGADGKLKAIEVHILPDALRGVVAEAQIPWDLVPDSIMTNAILTGTTTATGGQIMKVKYKDSEAEVLVPPDAPIVGYVPGDAGLLKPGAAVFLVAQKKDDGSLTAARVTAEKDGVKPPL